MSVLDEVLAIERCTQSKLRMIVVGLLVAGLSGGLLLGKRRQTQVQATRPEEPFFIA